MDNNDLLNKLINSLLEDRRIERRNKLIFRVFSGIFILFFLYILLFPSDRFSPTYEHTGLIEINGMSDLWIVVREIKSNKKLKKGNYPQS